MTIIFAPPAPERIWIFKGPRKGWIWSGVIDHGDLIYNCEACGTKLRYEHILTHPESESMGVGCVCAEHLTEDYINPKRKENALKKVKVSPLPYAIQPPQRS